jgi:hypothetical protein
LLCCPRKINIAAAAGSATSGASQISKMFILRKLCNLLKGLCLVMNFLSGKNLPLSWPGMYQRVGYLYPKYHANTRPLYRFAMTNSVCGALRPAQDSLL